MQVSKRKECHFLEVDGVDPLHKARMINHWVGYEDHIVATITTLASAFPKASKTKLHKYFSDRAYPYSRAIGHQLHLDPPPIGFLATAFRETKGGETRDRTGGQGSGNPLWSAIRSVLSAADALQHRADAVVSDIVGRTSDGTMTARNCAFLFDVEVLRRVLVHPVVFCEAQLFKLEGDAVSPIDAARLAIRDISFGYRYVDIVNVRGAETYIDRCIKHFESRSRSAIKNVWTLLAELEWEPGQAEKHLAQILRPLKRKPRQQQRARRAE